MPSRCRVRFAPPARVVLAGLAAGCSGAGVESASGIQAHRALRLAGELETGAVLLLAAVAVALAAALYVGWRRARGVAFAAAQTAPDRAAERRRGTLLAAATLVTAGLLAGAVAAESATRRAMLALADPDPLTITVTGRRWWWEIRYHDLQPSLTVTTANELHLPLGRVVKLQLRAVDEPHALFLPDLAGRAALVPGEDRVLWLRADRPGRFGGWCTEYCGQQHGNMRLDVIVEPPLAFERWLDNARRGAAAPVDTIRGSGGVR